MIIDENLCENSLEMGELLLNGLKSIRRPFIKDVRGKGLFCALEFEESEKYTAKQLCKKMMETGLLAKPTHETTIRFSPPLIITKQQIEQSLDIIEKAVKSL